MKPPSRATPLDLAPDQARDVAELAMREFLAAGATLTPLGRGDSIAFRAEARDAAYLLRVHVTRRAASSPAFFTPEAIESECAWLAALAAETDLVVQAPRRGPDGRFVVQVPHAGTAIACTLLTWIEGVHVVGRRTAEQATRLGDLIGRLHEHASAWTPPAGFERPVHDSIAWSAALARLDDVVALGVVEEADRALLAQALDIADGGLSPLAEDPARIGLIHADLHGENYLFHGGEARPLDFGRAGFGPWLVDLAECSQHLGPARRRDLVAAYARARPFEPADVRRVEGYFVGALVEVFGANVADPADHDYLQRAIPAWRPHVERYVTGRPFLFEL